MEQEREREQTDVRTAENVQVLADHYEKERVYVRQVASKRYTLTEARRERLRTVQRVFTPIVGDREGDRSIMRPSDDIFRTQSLDVHYVMIPPNGRNDGHGHQNEAFFYALEGSGFELHDGLRYDWQAGDAVAVHNDSVHWHNNPHPVDRAVCLVIKPKPLSLFLGLDQQGKIGTVPPNDDLWEPRTEWLAGRPDGDELIPKVLKPSDTPWEWSPFGHIRKLAGSGVPLRIKAIDAYLHEIPAGSRSGRRWQMADEVALVLEGEGYDLHWEVDAEITDKFYARVAKKPTRWEWKKGDVIWVPQNSALQRFAADGSGPARLIVGANRIFQYLGYSRVVHFENAPEFDAIRHA